MNLYLLGASLGGLSAFLFAIPAIVFHISSKGKERDVPLLVDVETAFGHRISRRAMFWLALLLHLVIGALFGAIYHVFVNFGWLFITHAPYTYLSLLTYAIGSWLFVGFVIFPVIGFGWFGRKEDPEAPLELLISMLLIGSAMWALVKFYQPVFF